MLRKLIPFFFIASQAFGNYPPTTLKSQTGGGATTFNFQTPFSQVTNTTGTTSLIETGSYNIVPDGSFEATAVATYWTKTGSDTLTLTTSGANLIFGTGTGTYTAAASGNTLSSSTVAVPKGLQGQSCYAEIYYLYAGTTGDYSFQIDDGAGNLLASAVSLPQATTPRLATINYPCGTGNNRLQIKSNVASPSAIYLDNAYMGGTKNVGTAQQAILVGGAVVTGCSVGWAQTGTSFTTTWTTTPTGCTPALFGAAQSAGNQAGIKFASLPPGDYMIQYEGTIYQNIGNKNSYFQFTDGTNTSREISTLSTTANIQVPGINHSFSYTAAQSNVTWQIQAKTDSGGSAQVFGTTANPGTFKLWYFPSSAQQAVKVDQTPASYSGVLSQAGGGWTNNSAYSTFGDYTVATTSTTLTNIQSRNITCVAESTKLPAITCTLPKTGLYQICANPSIYSNVANASTYTRLVDGSATIINSGTSWANPVNNQASPVLCGNYNATSVSSGITFKLQGSNGSSATQTIIGTTGSSINWTVVALDQGMAVPFLQGNVTSNTSGQERVERLTFAGNAAMTASCTTNPCTIVSQSGSWVTSVARTATGQVTVNVAAGIFSAVPTCTSYGDPIINTTGCALKYSTSTTTALNFTEYNFSGTASDGGCNIICMGPR